MPIEPELLMNKPCESKRPHQRARVSLNLKLPAANLSLY